MYGNVNNPKVFAISIEFVPLKLPLPIAYVIKQTVTRIDQDLLSPFQTAEIVCRIPPTDVLWVSANRNPSPAMVVAIYELVNILQNVDSKV